MKYDETLEETRRFDPRAWRGLWRQAKKERGAMLGIVVCAIATAAVDACFPLVTGSVIDAAIRDGAEVDLVPYALAYLGLATALALFVGTFIRLGGRIRTRIAFGVRQAGFENLQRLSFAYFDRRPVGWLMSRMTSDTDRLSQVFAWGVLDVVWDFALLGGISIVMLVINAKLALAVLAVMPLLALVTFRFQRSIFGSARRVRRANAKLTASYNEGIQGARTSKVFRRESADAAKFAVVADEMLEHSIVNQYRAAFLLPIVLTMGSLAAGAALVMGGFEVLAGTGLTVGTLIIFMNYAARFFQPIEELAHWFGELQMAQASAERIIGLIDEQPEIADGPDVHPESDPTSSVETIEFANIDFAYGNGAKVIEDFCLTVRQGQTIALVGETGGGKSTIVSLLARFYEPTAGALLFDGVDYRTRSLAWLRAKIAIVQQTPHLFSGTIAENLRLGRPEATAEEMEAAARTVGAHGGIAALPDGYETRVGEGGNRLSTGEKQLISLARALLADPEILVLDEATSSVDAATEARIQRGLERVLTGRTAFVIAHRLSTVRSADHILVIDKGRVLEAGSHAELLAQGGRYHALVTRFAADATWQPAVDPRIA